MVTQINSTSKHFIQAVSMSGTKKWLNRFNQILEKNLDDSFFSNQQLAAAMKISERHLFRKVKETSGLSPQKYLSQYRLKRAMKYLKEGKYRTVKETAYAVGFKNVSYFIRQFEKEFGEKPLQVLQDSGWR